MPLAGTYDGRFGREGGELQEGSHAGASAGAPTARWSACQGLKVGPTATPALTGGSVAPSRHHGPSCLGSGAWGSSCRGASPIRANRGRARRDPARQRFLGVGASEPAVPRRTGLVLFLRSGRWNCSRDGSATRPLARITPRCVFSTQVPLPQVFYRLQRVENVSTVSVVSGTLWSIHRDWLTQSTLASLWMPFLNQNAARSVA